MVYKIKTGLGYDIHKFAAGKSLILGGVNIPSKIGLTGHSDADVIFHALTDAILGAIGENDIGYHFPDTEEQWKNANSQRFVDYSIKMVQQIKGIIHNIDITIIAEYPKINDHRDSIRANIAKCCHLSLQDVNVKATTNEKMGYIGRKEGMAAMVLATISVPN